MVRIIPKIDISALMKNKRLAATMFEVEKISSKALEGLIDTLRAEKSRSLVPGRDRFSIEDFFFLPDEGFYVKSWIESEIKWREITIEGDITNIVEQTAYIYRDVHALLRISTGRFFVFSETAKDAWNFCIKIRNSTVGRLNPKKLSISSEGVRSLLPRFDSVICMRLRTGSEKGLDTISLRGADIMNSKITESIISQTGIEYLEVGGDLRETDFGVGFRLFINSKCRFWIYCKSKDVDESIIHNLIREIEAAQSTE